MLYLGTLLSSEKELRLPSRSEVGGGAKGGLSLGQSVLFSHDPKIVTSLRDTVHYCGRGEQDVLCINERKVMVKSKNMYCDPTNVALEGISSDLSKRPKTGASGVMGFQR
jgi:hypothetical protein